MNKIVIGIDQSYNDTGISISFNGKLKTATHLELNKFKTNSEKRAMLQKRLYNVFSTIHVLRHDYNATVMVIIERIRLRSQGFLNINYIKSIGALNALIVDTAFMFEYPVYSVDTRAWKSSIVGNSKGMDNPYGIDPKKYPTIDWCIHNGYKNKIKMEVSDRKSKGVIEKNGERYTYNDNIADSICISLYGFVKKPLLKEER